MNNQLKMLKSYCNLNLLTSAQKMALQILEVDKNCWQARNILSLINHRIQVAHNQIMQFEGLALVATSLQFVYCQMAQQYLYLEDYHQANQYYLKALYRQGEPQTSLLYRAPEAIKAQINKIQQIGFGNNSPQLITQLHDDAQKLTTF